MAKKKPKQTDAGNKAMTAILSSGGISTETKAALVARLSVDIEGIEAELGDLRPQYEEYLTVEQDYKLLKRMIAELNSLPIKKDETKPIERKENESKRTNSKLRVTDKTVPGTADVSDGGTGSP